MLVCSYFEVLDLYFDEEELKLLVAFLLNLPVIAWNFYSLKYPINLINEFASALTNL
ncbi:Conserved hypothetical protein [Clostridium neonatale]|nr:MULTISPECIES: hypothetical protein [Clostridium]CAG9712571.1 Conserved hypothetical protein [Clostridium neonatale]CAI3221291.1 Conserved hypothetical protein [Clostridium neonatale]CAI3233443.1 Conserved hypothetical protein [Clostridium neonatale]CAI3246441.1 Conserved hypothetical protein [Clostridium neonatale]CAI3539256.1 Conserved hypothetical protein [Clostridium neonatale]